MKNYELIVEGLRQAREKFLNNGVIDEETFNILVESDPTPQKKYIEKICQFYVYLKNSDPEYSNQMNVAVIQHLSDIIMMYHDSHLKNKFKNTPYQDIMQFKSWNEFKDVTYEYFAKSTRSELKKKDNKYNVREGNNAKIVYEDDEWLVTMPYNWEGVRYYGMGTKWCITYTEPNYFKSYFWDKGSSFYFIFSKELDKLTNDISEKHRFYKVAVEIGPDGEIEAFWDAPDLGNAPVSNDPKFIEWYSKVPNYVKDLIHGASPLGKVINKIGTPELRKQLFKVNKVGNSAVFEYIKGSKIKINFSDFEGIDSFEDPALDVINSQVILNDAPIVIERTSLKNLKGLPKTTGTIIIQNNPELISLEGLPPVIPNTIEIINNPKLESLEGMKNIEVHRDFRFANNKGNYTLAQILKDYNIKPRIGRIILR